jgi:hypothetical protein
MQNELTDIQELIDAIRDNFPSNAIVDYLIDEHITDCKYNSVDSLITDLEMAHCAAGSFSGMIYTQDILDRLSDPAWRDAIELAIDSYTDAAGESPEFDRDCMGYRDTFRLENTVTFAVDWMSNEIANFLRSNDRFYIVTQAVDSLDPSPERKVFLDEYEAQDYVSESLMHRMDYIVQHSPHSISESEYDALQEQELTLMNIEQESV